MMGASSGMVLPDPGVQCNEGKNMITLEKIRQANRVRQSEWPGNDRADVPFRAIELAGETGELMEAVKKWLRAKRGIKGEVGGLEAISDEVADVLICLDLLADDIGIDLGAAFTAKFNKTSRRYGFDTMVDTDGRVMK
jgi:NTP pyrophosphatase (non-canonical NTP hydrolase)